MYSINFSTLSEKYAQFMLRVFKNRVNIYFVKRAKCDSKKLMDLLPIFYKIMQEELASSQYRKDFYEHELINAFKDIRFKEQHQN